MAILRRIVHRWLSVSLLVRKRLRTAASPIRSITDEVREHKDGIAHVNDPLNFAFKSVARDLRSNPQWQLHYRRLYDDGPSRQPTEAHLAAA